MAKLYYTWDKNKVYQPLEYVEYPQNYIYICVETAQMGESPVARPLKWKLCFASGFPGTVTSIAATLPIAVSPNPITTTGTVTTSMATNKLIGRYTAGTGVMEEVTIGSGLTLSGGGTLSASLGGIAWLLDGNTVGSEKFIGTIDAYDFPIRTTNTERMVVSAGGSVGIGVAVPTARLHVVGSGTTSASINFFTANSDSSHTLAHYDDGKIFRNGYLYSAPTSNYTLTTWGTNAGFTLGTGSNSLSNTLIGYNAGYGLPNTIGEYNGNVIVGAYSITTGTTTLSVLIGNDAGARLAASYSSIQGGGQAFIGYGAASYCTTGINNISIGSFSNSVGASYVTTASYSICIGAWSTTGNYSGVVGFGSSPATSDNQIIFGGGYDSGTAFNYAYTDMYLGKGVIHGTPASFTIHATSGSGSNVAGANLQYAIGQATGDAASGDHLWYYAPSGSPGTTLTTLTEALRLKGTDGSLRASRRVETSKGANIASANDLTLGGDGNVFTITGNTQLNAITTANWQSGSVVLLIFTGTPTVKHDTAGGAGTATLKLLDGIDFTIAKNPTVITLVYDGTNWLEVSRSADAA